MHTRPTDPVDALLRAATERIFEAIAARDTASLEEELTADFAHTSVGGEEQDRSAFLAAIREMPYRVVAIRGQGVRVRGFGDVAVVSGLQRARVALPDLRIVDSQTAFVDIFVVADGRWRLRQAYSVEPLADA